MSKNLLLVSSDKQFYGLMPNSATSAFNCFCDTVVGLPSPEMLEKIKQIIQEKNVQAILTRGSWSIYLKERLTLPVFPLKIDASDIYQYIETPRKYYFSDLGLRNARINFRQFEPTHSMENVIYNELRMRGYSVDVGVLPIAERNQENRCYQRHRSATLR